MRYLAKTFYLNERPYNKNHEMHSKKKKFVRAKSAFFVCDRNKQESENERADGRRTQKLKEDKKRH